MAFIPITALLVGQIQLTIYCHAHIPGNRFPLGPFGSKMGPLPRHFPMGPFGGKMGPFRRHFPMGPFGRRLGSWPGSFLQRLFAHRRPMTFPPFFLGQGGKWGAGKYPAYQHSMRLPYPVYRPDTSGVDIGVDIDVRGIGNAGYPFAGLLGTVPRRFGIGSGRRVGIFGQNVRGPIFLPAGDAGSGLGIGIGGRTLGIGSGFRDGPNLGIDFVKPDIGDPDYGKHVGTGISVYRKDIAGIRHGLGILPDIEAGKRFGGHGITDLGIDAGTRSVTGVDRIDTGAERARIFWLPGRATSGLDSGKGIGFGTGFRHRGFENGGQIGHVGGAGVEIPITEGTRMGVGIGAGIQVGSGGGASSGKIAGIEMTANAGLGVAVNGGIGIGLGVEPTNAVQFSGRATGGSNIMSMAGSNIEVIGPISGTSRRGVGFEVGQGVGGMRQRGDNDMGFGIGSTRHGGNAFGVLGMGSGSRAQALGAGAEGNGQSSGNSLGGGGSSTANGFGFLSGAGSTGMFVTRFRPDFHQPKVNNITNNIIIGEGAEVSENTLLGKAFV